MTPDRFRSTRMPVAVALQVLAMRTGQPPHKELSQPLRRQPRDPNFIHKRTLTRYILTGSGHYPALESNSTQSYRSMLDWVGSVLSRGRRSPVSHRSHQGIAS